MHLQASDEASSDSGSGDFPVYQESQVNHSRKYVFQPNLSNTETKYKSQSHDKYKGMHRFSLQGDAMNEHTKLNRGCIENQEVEDERQTGLEAERFRLMLQKQIEKNKELEKQLFLREKQLLAVRSQDKPSRKPTVIRVQSPISNVKTQQIKLIQQELEDLKGQVQRNAVFKSRADELRIENTKLKKKNKKYKEFVDAIAVSLGIMGQKPPPKGTTQTWKVWRQVFNQMAKESNNKDKQI